MSRPDQSPSTRQLVAQGREVLALSRRAIALAQALQAMTGMQSHEAQECLLKDGGEPALERVRSRVAAMLDRAEVATRLAVGPKTRPMVGTRRARAPQHFI